MKQALTFDDVLLVPQFSDIKSRSLCDTSVELNNTKYDVPIMSSNMDTVTGIEMIKAMSDAGGLGILHRFMPLEEQVEMVRHLKAQGYNNFGVSIGVKSGFKNDIVHLYNAGARIFCIDIAHGHCQSMLDVVSYLSGYTNISVIAGNVVTKKAVDDILYAYGSADLLIKVGVGPGSICTTRRVSGSGYPQFSAVKSCAVISDVIADGGIRNSGDAAKALAAGAKWIMLGSALAGCDEALGELVEVNGKPYKRIRGMASAAAAHDRGIKNYNAPEGVEGLVPYTGPVKDVIANFKAGIQSGMSYSGAYNLNEFTKKAKFVRITNAGLSESHSHDIMRI